MYIYIYIYIYIYTHFSELFILKVLMKKFQQTQINITTSIIPGHFWKFFVFS